MRRTYEVHARVRGIGTSAIAWLASEDKVIEAWRLHESADPLGVRFFLALLSLADTVGKEGKTTEGVVMG